MTYMNDRRELPQITTETPWARCARSSRFVRLVFHLAGSGLRWLHRGLLGCTTGEA